MGGIGTSIELHDGISNPLMSIVNALNLTMSAFEGMQKTAHADIDTSSIIGAREQINQATMAIYGLEDAFSKIKPPDIPETPTAPTTWQGDATPVFTNTGVERFKQEIEATTNVMNRLSSTQKQIEQQAMVMDILPEGAVTDISMLSSRLEMVKSRINDIENNPLNMNSDVANSELEQLRSQLVTLVTNQEDLNSAMSRMDVNEINSAYTRLSSSVGSTEKYIRDNVDAQGQFNREVERSNGGYDGLMGKVLKVAGLLGIGFAAKETASNIYGAATQLEATEAKFNTVFDGMTVMSQGFIDDFQKLTPVSESSARAMASGIQDLLIPMGFARDEATKMTGETFNLIGALTNFNSATHSAEDVSSAFQSALTGEYQSLKALGIQVDSTTVKEKAVAMGLSRTTNEVTNQAEAIALMELAYEQSGDALNAYNQDSLDTISRMGILKQGFIDTFAEAGQSLLPKINDTLIKFQGYLPTIEAGIYAFASAFGTVIDVGSVLLGIVMNIAGFFVENWSFISPIIWGVVFALGAYTSALVIQNGIMLANTILSGIMAAKTGMQTAFNGAWTISTFAQTAAQQGLNAALLACPLTWILLLIIAIIAVFYIAIAAVNRFAGTSISATGIVMGVFFTLCAHIQNVFILIWNAVANFINFFANVWDNPVASVQILFFDMVQNVIGYIENMASAIENVINAIPGVTVDITSGLDNIKKWASKASADIKLESGWKEVASQKDFVDYKDAYSKGYGFGGNLGNKVSDMLTKPDTSVIDTANSSSTQAEVANGINQTATNTGEMKDAIDISEENLKYMLDIAERDSINKFTTAEIKIEQTNHNTVSSGMDLDGITDHLTVGLNEAIDKSAEGVHD